MVKYLKGTKVIEATGKNRVTMTLKDKDVLRFKNDYGYDTRMPLTMVAARMLLPNHWVDMSAYGGVDKRKLRQKRRDNMGTLWTVLMDGVDEVDTEKVRDAFELLKADMANGIPESSYFKEMSRGDTKEKASEVTFIFSLGNIADRGINKMANKVDHFLKEQFPNAKLKTSKKQE